MRTVLGVIVLLLFCGMYAVAQDYPKAEVFGGYSLLHIDTEGVSGSTLDSLTGAPAGTFSVKTNYSGWNAAVQYNVTRSLGITADFSGHYGTPIQVNVALPPGTTLPTANSFSFLFGPTISHRGEHFKPFVHALFGANHVKTNSFTVTGFGTVPEFSDTAFAMAFGGGLDLKMTQRFLIRVGQIDYLFTKHDFSGGVPGVATHQNNFRFSAGVVIAF